jgi:hypothetical protein
VVVERCPIVFILIVQFQPQVRVLPEVEVEQFQHSTIGRRAIDPVFHARVRVVGFRMRPGPASHRSWIVWTCSCAYVESAKVMIDNA